MGRTVFKDGQERSVVKGGVIGLEELQAGINIFYKEIFQDEVVKFAAEMKDLASTLLAVVVKDEKFIALHIRDGVIGILDGDFLTVMSHPITANLQMKLYL